ncbi:V-type ATP synthase subunit F [Thermococcus onnurineus NA1]|uniref:A-type ATP synthase subunit F n=1 Tax=Thermococcus onnurineus (strain NA1) TaxID=523850 RepID=AATF_THEON|nr:MULTISPECIES: V-type ATP synthase subunit F [Thermococcus]B6YV13.1 RecName: Full=V-type ATP synthase subunit F; AltName: Full=V-ATPase subunit F [Thermococcus onnurineus NA1]ACJ17241.1 V-type ATP synthase subunit F [Thermococcus onnurineus NA1]NJE46016.1 V-type ATP synthase subunit F [Thermococcus sp. GR7]NJE78510.1 V-type ATP synthase subunit F [Thermococcus sp. GR4]NJF22213.1 V-type ATP synthase subunit F [Thermococcus sp. GR5]
MKIAVLGDKDTALGFKLAGAHEVYSFEDTPLDMERLKNKLNELVEREDIGIILITERFVQKIGLPDVTFPIILQVPDKSGSKFGEEAIKEIVRRAIGVELKR